MAACSYRTHDTPEEGKNIRAGTAANTFNTRLPMSQLQVTCNQLATGVYVDSKGGNRSQSFCSPNPNPLQHPNQELWTNNSIIIIPERELPENSEKAGQTVYYRLVSPEVYQPKSDPAAPVLQHAKQLRPAGPVQSKPQTDSNKNEFSPIGSSRLQNSGKCEMRTPDQTGSPAKRQTSHRCLYSILPGCTWFAQSIWCLRQPSTHGRGFLSRYWTVRLGRQRWQPVAH